MAGILAGIGGKLMGNDGVLFWGYVLFFHPIALILIDMISYDNKDNKYTYLLSLLFLMLKFLKIPQFDVIIPITFSYDVIKTFIHI